MKKPHRNQVPPDFLHRVWSQLPLHIRLNIIYTTWLAVRPNLHTKRHHTGKRLLVIQILSFFVITAFLINAPTVHPLTPLISWAASVCVAIILTSGMKFTERRFAHKMT